jgi:ssDNA-binding Zn-finger/Zn-ribbon topoisomerase 1
MKTANEYDDNADEIPARPGKCPACGKKQWIRSPADYGEFAGYECGECGEFIRDDDQPEYEYAIDDGHSDADPGL